jgi:hypothetical protein
MGWPFSGPARIEMRITHYNLKKEGGKSMGEWGGGGFRGCFEAKALIANGF